MAYILELSDGTTTVDLLNELGSSPWCNVEDGGLRIRFPSKKQTWAGSNIWRQGRELELHAYENRKISITFEIGGDTWDDILDGRGIINRLLEKAREYQLTGLSSDVTLKFQLDTTTNPVWFDVLDGDLVIPEDLMSIEKLHWTKGSGYTLKECRMDLTCKPFARGAEVQIVTASDIYNASEGGGHNNYVSWVASAIKGDFPGPLRIRWKNTYSSADRMDNIYVGLRDVGDPANWIEVLEAESYDEVYQSGSSQGPSASYSNSYGIQWTTSGTTSELKLLRWEIPQESVPLDTKGKVRAIAVGYFDWLASYRLKASFELTDLRAYPLRRPPAGGPGRLDLGVIDLQPWPVEYNQSAGYWHLDFYIKGDNTSSHLTLLDAIYFVPAEDYKFRKWPYIGYNAAQNDMVEDIGRLDQVAHHEAAGAYKHFIVDWDGLPIHATPNQAARLFFLWETATGNYHPDYTARIDVWHTPYYMDVRGTG